MIYEETDLDRNATRIVEASLKSHLSDVRVALYECEDSYRRCKVHAGVKLSSARLAQIYDRLEKILTEELERLHE